MMSTTGLTPFAFTLSAASKIALALSTRQMKHPIRFKIACISEISGWTIPKRQPLNPSIGLVFNSIQFITTVKKTTRHLMQFVDFVIDGSNVNSCSLICYWYIQKQNDIPNSFAIIWQTSFISPLGKNSWRGGSSSLNLFEHTSFCETHENLIVTVFPSMAVNIPSKSARCKRAT